MRRFAFLAGILVAGSLLLRLFLDVSLALRDGSGFLFGVVKFATAFTHLTNAVVGFVLVAHAIGAKSKLGRRMTQPWVFACAATYITVMALTWKIMLAPTFATGFHMMAESMDLEKVASLFLHGINPALFVCIWFLSAPKRKLRWTDALWWPVGALGYFAVILIRGAIIGRYPYPFVDVTEMGYPQVMANAAVLLLGFVAVGLIYIAVDKWDPLRSICQRARFCRH